MQNQCCWCQPEASHKLSLVQPNCSMTCVGSCIAPNCNNSKKNFLRQISSLSLSSPNCTKATPSSTLPNGCPCTKSWDCNSNWCDNNVCKKHPNLPPSPPPPGPKNKKTWKCSGLDSNNPMCVEDPTGNGPYDNPYCNNYCVADNNYINIKSGDIIGKCPMGTSQSPTQWQCPKDYADKGVFCQADGTNKWGNGMFKCNSCVYPKVTTNNINKYGGVPVTGNNTNSARWENINTDTGFTGGLCCNDPLCATWCQIEGNNINLCSNTSRGQKDIINSRMGPGLRRTKESFNYKGSPITRNSSKTTSSFSDLSSLSASSNLSSLSASSNCDNVICTQDVCWDGKSRRQIGNNCCACPPGNQSSDCDNENCKRDLCGDGHPRRQIGNNCCACPWWNFLSVRK